MQSNFLFLKKPEILRCKNCVVLFDTKFMIINDVSVTQLIG